MRMMSARTLGATCAGLSFGVLVGLTAPSWGVGPNGVSAAVLAQAAPADAGLGSRIAVLQAQVDALTKRVDDAEKGARKAPFIVTNSQGVSIFSVSEAGGGGEVRIGGAASAISLKASDQANLSFSAGGSSAVVSAGSAGPRLQLLQGQTSVDLAAKDGAPSVSAKVGNKQATMGQFGSAASYGFFVASGSSGAALGQSNAGQFLLKILPPGGGQHGVEAGYDGSGHPAVNLWDGANRVLRLDGDGAGRVTVFDSGKEAARLEANSGAGAVTVLDGGKEAAVLGKGENYTGLRITSGSDEAFLGDLEGSLRLSLEKGGSPFFQVDGTSGNGQLLLGKAGETTWRMTTDADWKLEGQSGSNIVDMGTASSAIGQAGAGFRASLGNDTRAFIGVGSDNEGAMHIFKEGSKWPVISAGYGAGTNGLPAFRVRASAGGEELAVLGSKDETQGELTLSDKAGEVAKMSALNGIGTLALSQAGKPILTMGPTATKSSPAFRAYKGSDVVLAAGVTTNGSGAVSAFSGDESVAGILSSPAGGNVYVADQGGNFLASINTVDNPGKGLVVVRNSAGAAVAALQSGSSGGGNVTTMDPSGNGVFSAGYIGGDGPGAACVEHKGTKCLGIGLTGLEGFH